MSLTEREEISRGLAADKSIKTIAAELGRAHSTISREIAKNKGPTRYRAIDANDRATRNRARPQRLKLQKNPVFVDQLRQCPAATVLFTGINRWQAALGLPEQHPDAHQACSDLSHRVFAQGPQDYAA